MGFRTRTAVALFTALAGLTMIVAPAGSVAAEEPYVFPSTNDANRDGGLPHVNFVSSGPGKVTLKFVNVTNSLAFFEYRIDGQIVSGPFHPVVVGDVIYPGIGVDCRTSGEDPPPCTNSPQEYPFPANVKVEVRLALGGERDWDFDWTTFLAVQPMTKADCKRGGWADFGFRNQGQCIKFVNTGTDSR